MTTAQYWPYSWWAEGCGVNSTGCQTCGIGVTIVHIDGNHWAYCHGTAGHVSAGQEIAAGTQILISGNTGRSAVEHLAAHAPTPETCAAATVEIVDRPVDAFVFAARRAGVEDLVALSERYGLSPHETAAILALACVPLDKAVGVVHERCDGELVETVDVCRETLGIGTQDVTAALTDHPFAPVVALADHRHRLDHSDPNHGFEGVGVDGLMDHGVDL